MLKQFLLVIMTASLLSCANMPNSAGDLAQNEALQGGLLGGLLCGGAAKLAGLNREQIVIATAGCAGIGAIVGQQLRERRKKYASDEEFFDGEIKVAQQFNSDQVIYKDRLVAEVSELKAENQMLVELQNKKGVSGTKLSKHRTAIKSKQQKVKTETRKMKEELKFQEALYTKLKDAKNSSSRLANLKKEVSKLKQAIVAVENQQSQLAELDDNLI
ncbi:hypothetical protein QUF74_06740 [Candidatus Halobeggiatoa sp. HSG11]|nr:hypothetical protein [Candidatus Halobeggiatoa sp. HSG11]